jgi:hypothetical protein
LGERRRQQQKRCQTARNLNVCPAQHALVPCQFQLTYNWPRNIFSL